MGVSGRAIIAASIAVHVALAAGPGLAAEASAQEDVPFEMPGQSEQAEEPFVPPASRCAQGRIRVEMGYCCWPSQHASAEGRCLGPPRCPAGLVASGADCVSPTGSHFDVGAGRRRLPPPGGNQADGGLLGGGIALLLVGWVGTGITYTIGGQQAVFGRIGSVRPALPLWPFGWIPIFPLVGVIDSAGSWTLIAGIVGAIGTLLEISGLLMAIAGAAGHPRTPPQRWGVRVGAIGADAGITFELDL